eukprot:1158554-Pelagomonas_calceolata.AAC.2
MEVISAGGCRFAEVRSGTGKNAPARDVACRLHTRSRAGLERRHAGVRLHTIYHGSTLVTHILAQSSESKSTLQSCTYNLQQRSHLKG